VRTGNAAAPFVYWDLSTLGSGNRDVRVTPTDPSGEFPTLLASGNVTLPNCGFDFDARRNRFALWCGDGRVWMLTPPATASPLGWTIVRQPAPTLAQPNGDVGTGILGKWKYIPNLDAFIGLQDYTQGNIWIYKPVGWTNPVIGLAQTITFAALPDKTLGAPPFAISATATSGLPVAFGSSTPGVCTVTGNTVTLVAAGNCTITADQSGNATYSAAPQVSRTFLVSSQSTVTNVALASVGAVATASSQYSSAYPVSAVNNGDRKGAVWGAGGGWNDATANAYPDDVQIDFNGSKTIDRVVVYTLQDNYSSPVEPTDTLTFSAYGVTAFTVEGWNGSGWTVLGSVSNNNLVKRTVTFAPYSTNAIRIRVTQALAQFSRLVEVEAWSVTEP